MNNEKKIVTVNPANEETIAEYDYMSQQEVAQVLANVQNTFYDWKKETFATRADHMTKLASLLREQKTELAALMTAEMGKVKTQAEGEIEKCAWACEYYAEHAADMLADHQIETGRTESFVTYQPQGIVLAVMPWNFPFWQVIRFAAPTLMAGNAAVLKHARSVSGVSYALEKLFIEAGFPEHLFRSVFISGAESENIIAHPAVRAVTLTGSVPAGKAVASLAGKYLKKTVMELGGSDPYLILEDADLEHAAEQCATSRLLNTGQSCIAAKRFIVVEAVYEDFIDALQKQMTEKNVGDPTAQDTEVGPMSSVALRDELHEQVTASIDKGARCVIGCEVPEQKGAWYPPSILADVTEGMPAYSEELFGPVASVIKAKDEKQAIQIANDSVFGLGGGVFTKDEARGREIARTQIDSGGVAVNGFVKSDPRLPFGGVKESGYGRELAHFGIHEFVNIKTVIIE